MESLLLPLADAPSIVQSHQKDEQVSLQLVQRLSEVLKDFKSQLFVNSYPTEISLLGNVIYLAVTTLRNVRTLGEQYTDLIYVNRNGKSLVKSYKRLVFILLYAISPYIGNRLQKMYPNYANVLQKLSNVHLILFYFTGGYYEGLKRFLEMKYAVGHIIDEKEQKFRSEVSQTYKLLGQFVLIQNITQLMSSIKKTYQPEEKKQLNSKKSVTLNDVKQLTFIPEDSRDCSLCLNKMTDPSVARCGHIFCWDCIISWTKERPECPLCRQSCQVQQVLPIR